MSYLQIMGLPKTTVDKNPTCSLVITSEIYKGRVIFPKALVLQDECFALGRITLKSEGETSIFSGLEKSTHPLAMASALCCRTSKNFDCFNVND